MDSFNICFVHFFFSNLRTPANRSAMVLSRNTKSLTSDLLQ